MAFEFTDSNFEETASNGVVFVHFSATWSAPCRAIAPIIEELAAEFREKAVVGKLDVENNREVALKYGILSIPAFLFLKDGQVIDRHVGLTSKSVLGNKLYTALASM